MAHRTVYTFNVTAKFNTYLADVIVTRVKATTRLEAIRKFFDLAGRGYSIIAVARAF